MGNEESSISYVEAQNRGRQEAQEENERRMRELQEKVKREREQALRDAQESAKCDDEKQRRILDHQRRSREERERQIREEKDFRELRKALMNYDFQEFPRIKKESFRDLYVGDIDLIRIALIGPAGSGKTSFAGTLQRAIGETQSAFEQGRGDEGDILLQEYFVQKNIRLVDTRGFFESNERLFEECLNIMTGRIRPGEEIKRNYDSRQTGQRSRPAARKAQEFAKYAHAVIFVVKANDPRLKDGKYKDALKKIREHFREDGCFPVTVVTCLDQLKDEEAKGYARCLASMSTGSSETRTYLIENYTHENKETSLEVERTALGILEYALISAETFIRIRKQREKNQMEREATTEGARSGVETIEQFFARMKIKHNWTEQGKMKEVVSDLRSKDINTAKALKELWKNVATELPLSVGMKRVLEVEIKNI